VPELDPSAQSALRRHPPFDRIGDEAADALVAAGLRRLDVDVGELVFRQGGSVGDPAVFYVVESGAVALVRARPGDEEGVDGTLVDVCDDGDVFGIRPLLAGSRVYSASARAEEPSALLAVPFDAFAELLRGDANLALFFAAGFAAELPERRDQAMLGRSDEARRSLAPSDLGLAGVHDLDPRPVEPTRDVLAVSPTATVAEAARAMRQRSVGSVVVADGARRPVGILTDTDIRNRVVAADRDPGTTAVRDVMSAPVQTVEDGLTTDELVAHMLTRGQHHLCVTEDGTPATPLTGVITERDVLDAQGSAPTGLAHAVGRAGDGQRLRVLRDRAEGLVAAYLDGGMSVAFVRRVLSAIDDALVRRAVELALAAMDRPTPGPFCWLTLGSGGRQEQLLRSDQDNALLYADPSAGDGDGVSAFYLDLARRVVDLLVAAGFAPCPGDVMASNPRWNRPLGGWRETFAHWIRAPNPQALLKATIFFDLRPVAGDASLAGELWTTVRSEIRRQETFLTRLAQLALSNPPPLGFFRQLLLERSGDHQDTFDLKARALAPLADAARVLALELLDRPWGSTAGRFEAVAGCLPSHAELAAEAGTAYDILLRYRAQAGLRRGDSGRYLDIDRLSKLDRRTLRNTFAVVDDVQRLLRTRYRTDLLR